MKRIAILLLIVIISSICFGDTVFVKNTIVIPDSVLIKSLNVGAVKHPFWDNLPTFIGGFISLCAIGLTIWSTNRNLKSSRELIERQLKVQLATTVEKEWVQAVRNHVSIMVNNARVVAHYNNKKSNNQIALNDGEYIKNLDAFSDSNITLALFLNDKNPLEKELLLAATKLFIQAVRAKGDEDVNNVIKQGQLVIAAAHNLFESKRA